MFSFLKLICLATCLSPEPHIHPLFLTPLYSHPFQTLQNVVDTKIYCPATSSTQDWLLVVGWVVTPQKYVCAEPQDVTFYGRKIYIDIIEVRILR